MKIKSFFLAAFFFIPSVLMVVGQDFMDPISENQYNTWMEHNEKEQQELQDSLAGASKQERISYLESFFSIKLTELNTKYNELKELSEKKFAKKDDVSQFNTMMDEAKFLCNIVQASAQTPTDIQIIAETEILVALKAQFDSVKQKLDQLPPPEPIKWLRILLIAVVVLFVLYTVFMQFYNKRKAKKAVQKAKEDAKQQQTKARTEQLKNTSIPKI